ncbi:MAG: DNA mismatch repair protein MutS, partial [Chlamydiia bacterium]|nr:DNA mismatch repair protein MutS [Chlamydiia bacterium]
MTSKTETTPMMQQWHDCKKSCEEALLLFQMGDFYEAFYNDAVIVAKELELTLTKRQEIPMAGVPLHTLDSYIDRLVSKGYRVAIAEQMEDPREAKGLVRRAVVRIVTPGTILSANLVPEKTNNFFVALTQVGALYGLAFIDLSTGEFQAAEFEEVKELFAEIHRLKPAEIYTSKSFKEKNGHSLQELKHSFSFLLTTEENWRFDHQLSYETLLSQFKIQSLDGFGLKGKVSAINAAGGLVSYLKDTLLHSLDHLSEIGTYSTAQFMTLDPMTQANLELTEARGGGRKGSLLDVLDHTCTAMGGRLLRQLLKQPLLDCNQIRSRQDAVDALLQESSLRRKIGEHLSLVRDVERIIAKISLNSASPRDLQALSSSFRSLPFLRQETTLAPSALLKELGEGLDPLPEMTQLIDAAIADEPPLRLSDGGAIRPGFHEELDELRKIRSDSKAWISCYQDSLRQQYGIKTLKVGYNRMFGYYIEVSKGQADRMPDSFQRRQTLVNAERYIS